jgi:5-methylcytosine-specific restriction endonuclease McrA
MKIKKPDAEHVWKQLDDVLVPNLRLSITERGIYSHLLRHSRLEGRALLRFSLTWLARGARVSRTPARHAVHRLIAHGALRLVKRNNAGHVVEVRLPDEILRTRHGGQPDQGGNDLEADFLTSKARRQAIHNRERGFCFYCLRRLTPLTRCLDHVVPRVSFGSNSYRNLVSCCLRCNSQKKACAPEDFFRWLYRQRRLTDAELTSRLRALDALASGKLRPTIAPIANPRHMGRSPLNPATL